MWNWGSFNSRVSIIREHTQAMFGIREAAGNREWVGTRGLQPERKRRVNEAETIGDAWDLRETGEPSETLSLQTDYCKCLAVRVWEYKNILPKAAQCLVG